MTVTIKRKNRPDKVLGKPSVGAGTAGSCTLMERMRAAMDAKIQREGIQWNQGDLAQYCEVSEAAVSAWFSGTTKTLRGRNLLGAADFFDVAANWLYEGPDATPLLANSTTKQRSNLVTVNRLTHLSTSEPGTQPTSALVDGTLAFRKDWLEQRGLRQEALQVFECAGDAMSPHIEPGDVVLVDTQAGAPKDNEVWLIWQMDAVGLRVKRLRYTEAGSLIIRSDNSDKSRFPDELVPVSRLDSVRTIGKVVWRGG
jgi:phage repressor protein C with HTH and peptisase S24 domain